MLEIYASRRAVLLDGLDEIGFTYGEPAGAFYVYIEHRGERPAGDRILRRAARAKRASSSQPGILFADPDDRYVRMSLLQPKERIQEALGRIKEARGRLFRA